MLREVGGACRFASLNKPRMFVVICVKTHIIISTSFVIESVHDNSIS